MHDALTTRAAWLRTAGIVTLTLGSLSCGPDEPLDPQVSACLDAFGEIAVSRRFPAERDGRLCSVRIPAGCIASRRAAEGERTACETIDLHAGRGTEAIGAELTISCRDDRRPEGSIRVWGYLDKKFPRIAGETFSALQSPSALPNCAGSFYLPSPSDSVGWVAREVTFFPGDDGSGTPLVTDNASWDYQLRRIEWEHRQSRKRDSSEFLDDVFPLEFEQAIRSNDPGAADWVRIYVPGAQRLTYEKHPIAAD